MRKKCDLDFIILIGNLGNLLIIMRKGTGKSKSPFCRVDLKIYTLGGICSHQWRGDLVTTFLEPWAKGNLSPRHGAEAWDRGMGKGMG